MGWRLVTVGRTHKNPAKTSLNRGRRSSGSRTLAVKQHVTEDINTKEDVNVARGTKLGVSQLKTPQMLPSSSPWGQGEGVKQKLPW